MSKAIVLWHRHDDVISTEPDKAAQRRIRRWILEQRYESLRADLRRDGEHAGPAQAQSSTLSDQAE